MGGRLVRVSQFPSQTLWRTQGPQTRPITLEQAKQHLRLGVSDSGYDADVLDKLDSAIERVEKDTETAMIEQKFESRRDRFPSYQEGIKLDRNPVTSVEKVRYLDPTDGEDYIEIDAADYYWDEGHRAVFPKVAWPSAYSGHRKAVIVDFTAGFGATGASVPRQWTELVLLMLSMLFYHEDHMQQYLDLIKPMRQMGYPSLS